MNDFEKMMQSADAKMKSHRAKREQLKKDSSALQQQRKQQRGEGENDDDNNKNNSTSSLSQADSPVVTTIPKVDELIASNRVVVFSKSYCPYCRQAKMLLQSIEGLEFVTIEMDDDNHDGWQLYVSNVAKQKGITGTETCNTLSVPQIFIQQQYIGGADDLADLYHSERAHLEKMLGKSII